MLPALLRPDFMLKIIAELLSYLLTALIPYWMITGAVPYDYFAIIAGALIVGARIASHPNVDK